MSGTVPPSLFVVIPAYDAASTIGAVVQAVVAQGLPVLVVDDGSADDTGLRAQQAGARLIRHEDNRGKAAALKSGFALSLQEGAAAVLTLDADGQHDPQEIPGLLVAHQQQPEALVIGVRSFSPQVMPRRSRIGNNISTFFISLFCGQRFQDSQSGYRIYPRRLLQQAPLQAERFAVETELLLWSGKLGIPVVEVPICTLYAPHWAEDPSVRKAPYKTHFRTWDDTLRILRLVVMSPLWGLTRRDHLRLPQPPLEAK